MKHLFEYGDWEKVKNSKALKDLLISIWKMNDNFLEDEAEENKTDKYYQPFLSFSNDEVRAKNYVGFIQTADDLVEIYPKVFRNCPEKNKKEMLRHLFFWLSYCRKWNFRFSQAQLDELEIDEFPELIIHLISTYFLETITNQPFAMYQSIEEAMQTPRGSINFKRYIENSLSKANYQNIECDYEPFLLDNKVNRMIKYCSRLLMSQTKLAENLQILQEIISILDEVEDISFSYFDAENLIINPFFEEYNRALDYCKLILNQQLYSNDACDLSQWCLLLPMEYIFEDFVAGFLEDKFSNDWRVEYQKSNEYLSSNPKVFQMKHDIFLTSKRTGKTIIIDTKYKIRDKNFKQDRKKGIEQSDLYQMTSYAFRRGCTDVLLLYPNLENTKNFPDYFEICSGFNLEDKIKITAMEIPFWAEDQLNVKDLEDNLFNILESQLKFI